MSFPNLIINERAIAFGSYASSSSFTPLAARREEATSTLPTDEDVLFTSFPTLLRGTATVDPRASSLASLPLAFGDDDLDAPMETSVDFELASATDSPVAGVPCFSSLAVLLYSRAFCFSCIVVIAMDRIARTHGDKQNAE